MAVEMQTPLYTTAPKVLILEDEPLILMDMESTLMEASYEVRTATTGPEALALLDAHAFDVAVLDVGLRSGNSIAVANALLKRAIPFVFSTGSSDPIPIEFAAIPVNSKPFNNEEFVSIVGSVVATMTDGPRQRTRQ